MNRAYRDYCRHMGEAMCRRHIFTEPTLSQEELLAVYQTAKSTDLDILRDTAVRMFPERFQEKPPQLYAHQGGASAFQHHGVVTRLDCTIGAVPQRGPRKADLQALWGEEPQWNGRAFAEGGSEGYGTRGDEIGVMADGMAYPY